jgi:hypothetical protein
MVTLPIVAKCGFRGASDSTGRELTPHKRPWPAFIVLRFTGAEQISRGFLAARIVARPLQQGYAL